MLRIPFKWTLSLLCVFMAASWVLAQPTTVSLTSQKDSYIDSHYPTANYGSSSKMLTDTYVYSRGLYAYRRSFVEFDLSTIPSDAIIYSATLRLTRTGAVTGSATWKTKLIQSSWSEGTITATNQPAISVLSGDIVSSVPNGSGNVDSINVKDMVQRLVHGQISNYGWSVQLANESYAGFSGATFYTHEDANTGYRPELLIEYYSPLSLSNVIVSHESASNARDGGVAFDLAGGASSSYTYSWINGATGNVISTSDVLSGVSYGWYGVHITGAYGENLYQAFLVGLQCEEVSIDFKTSPEYTDNSFISSQVIGTTNYGDIAFGGYAYLETDKWTSSGIWYDSRSLIRPRIWVDNRLTISQADMILFGYNHSTLGGSNAAQLTKVTEDWTKNLVTWNTRPITSTSIIDSIPATTSATQNNTVDLKRFFNDWKADNSLNYGISLELQNTSDYYHRQQYYSPTTGTKSNRPDIHFKVDLRDQSYLSFATAYWDNYAETGSITYDIREVCGKKGPYHFMISQEEIPDFFDVYHYLNDSLQITMDSVSYFTGSDVSENHVFSNLSEGVYYVAAFGSDGQLIHNEKVYLQGLLSFDQQSNLAISGSKITATADNAIGTLQLYLHDGLNSELQISLDSLSDTLFVGYANAPATLTGYRDLKFGFYKIGNHLHTVESGVFSHSSTILTGGEILSLKTVDSILSFRLNDTELRSAILPAEFYFNVEAGMNKALSGITIIHTGIFKKKVRLKSKIFQYLSCDGNNGSFSFSMNYLGAAAGTVSGTFTITHQETGQVIVSYGVISNQQSIPVLTNGVGGPLEAGTYLISVTVNGIVYTTTVYLGYEANWDPIDLVDFDLVPNNYSLLRTLPNFTSTSYARAKNVLQSSLTGWVEFRPVTDATFAYSLMRISAQNIVSNTLSPTEDFLAFVRFGNSVILLRRINSVIDYNLISLDALIRIKYLSGQMEIWANNVLKATPITSAQTRLVRCQTAHKDYGFENIVTSFGCNPKQPLSKIGYTELKRELDGGYATAVEGKIKFTFDEEYEIESGDAITLNIYDNNNVLIEQIDANGTSMNGTPGVAYFFDDNKRILDISGIPGLITDEHYILEVITSTEEKLYMRFIYKY